MERESKTTCSGKGWDEIRHEKSSSADMSKVIFENFGRLTESGVYGELILTFFRFVQFSGVARSTHRQKGVEGDCK